MAGVVLPGSTHWSDRIGRYPVVGYFLLTFAISWTGALILLGPKLAHGIAVPKMTGLMIFPTMLIGPVFAGTAMTLLTGGASGLRDLLSRMGRLRVGGRWFLALLIPPALVFTVLLLFKTVVSPAYAPNRFVVGIVFGVFAGFWEEIGWTGFAFPQMARRMKAFPAALLLGFLWSAWHIPAIDYLGTATPHGAFWLPFFLAFAAAMTAVRVLISWLYVNTRSVLLAQMMHAASTGALVVLSPPVVTPAQEWRWYAAYALVLWAVVALVASLHGTGLLRQPSPFVRSRSA